MDIGARIQAALDAGLDVEIRITPTKDRRPGRIIDGLPAAGVCPFCGRPRCVPCMNTRDMDRIDGMNTDPICHAALVYLGSGERGRKD